MKYLIIAILFIGCKHQAKEKLTIDDFEVELLFEKDGCKMYRFFDGNYVYWTNCEGKSSYEYTTRSGKTTTIHEVQQITTK